MKFVCVCGLQVIIQWDGLQVVNWKAKKRCNHVFFYGADAESQSQILTRDLPNASQSAAHSTRHLVGVVIMSVTKVTPFSHNTNKSYMWRCVNL